MGKKINSSYEVDGRLGDVIAAVTVLAAAKESEGGVDMWAYRLSRPEGDKAEDSRQHWLNVFKQHPEFFLVYEWGGQTKVALRLRYANKTIDPKTGELHVDFLKLTPKERGELTSLPLDAPATGTLINTAVSLHQATLARKADARFLWQTFGPAGFALIGALIGLLGPSVLKGLQPPTEPLKVSVGVLKLEWIKPPQQDGTTAAQPDGTMQPEGDPKERD